jgi:hypothetical protein
LLKIQTLNPQWKQRQAGNYKESRLERRPIQKEETALACIERSFGKMRIYSFLGNSLYSTENTQILDRYKESRSVKSEELEELLKSEQITLETKFQIEILLNPKRHYPI